MGLRCMPLVISALQWRSTEALRLRPDYAEPHYYLGLAYEALGRRGDAIESFGRR